MGPAWFTVKSRPKLLARAVLKQGGVYFTLVFSDEEPDWGGPRRVTKAEILATFDKRWQVEAVEKARFEDHFGRAGARAWLSTIRRV